MDFSALEPRSAYSEGSTLHSSTVTHCMLPAQRQLLTGSPPEVWLCVLRAHKAAGPAQPCWLQDQSTAAARLTAAPKLFSSETETEAKPRR